MATCDGCDAEVRYLENDKTGKRAPVNVDPDPSGNVTIPERGKYHVMTKAEKEDAAPSLFDAGPPTDRYTLHFATCPRANHFRRCGTCHQSPCRCA